MRLVDPESVHYLFDLELFNLKSIHDSRTSIYLLGKAATKSCIAIIFILMGGGRPQHTRITDAMFSLFGQD